MIAKYILAAAALVFIGAALLRRSPGGPLAHPQSRAWLIVGILFAAVSAWLFARAR